MGIIVNRKYTGRPGALVVPRAALRAGDVSLVIEPAGVSVMPQQEFTAKQNFNRFRAGARYTADAVRVDEWASRGLATAGKMIAEPAAEPAEEGASRSVAAEGPKRAKAKRTKRTAKKD